MDSKIRFVLEMPEEVAEELLQDPAFAVPFNARSTTAEFASYVLTAMNVGATVVALSQGPEAVRKAIRAVERWRNRSGETCELQLRGPAGTVTVGVVAGAVPDLEQLIATVTGPTESG